MCKGVWGSVREGEKKDPRATARAARGGEQRRRAWAVEYVNVERGGSAAGEGGRGRKRGMRGRCQLVS
jgi:hypothetical protein